MGRFVCMWDDETMNDASCFLESLDSKDAQVIVHNFMHIMHEPNTVATGTDT